MAAKMVDGVGCWNRRRDVSHAQPGGTLCFCDSTFVCSEAAQTQPETDACIRRTDGPHCDVRLGTRILQRLLPVLCRQTVRQHNGFAWYADGGFLGSVQ